MTEASGNTEQRSAAFPLLFRDTAPSTCDAPLSNCAAAPSNGGTALANCDTPVQRGVSQFGRVLWPPEGAMTQLEGAAL